MDNLNYFIAIALSVLTGAAIASIVLTFKDQRRQIGELKCSVDSLKANYGHTAVGRARNDIAEDFQFQLALLKNDEKIIGERIAHMERIAQANMNPGGKTK